MVELLAEGPANQSAIIERLKAKLGANHKTTKRVLRDHAGRHWVARPGMNYGELRYYRPDHAAGILPRGQGSGGLGGLGDLTHLTHQTHLDHQTHPDHRDHLTT